MTARHDDTLVNRLQPVVLDSNVVLDLWFFADPRVASLRQAIEGGQLRWVTTSALQDELSCVFLRRETSLSEKVDANKQRVLQAFSAWSQRHGSPITTGHRLRCTDADDQKFVDLALSIAPAWLLSRDKAVLKLARRAIEFRVRIATPEQWQAGATSVVWAVSAVDKPSVV